MKLCALVLITFAAGGALMAQVAPVASHAPSMPMASHAMSAPMGTHGTPAAANGGLAPMTQEQMAGKTAIRVNGAEISELDVRREMVTIFPYAIQHNGFPKDMEPEIRKGAVEMIVFEELLYQEAKRRNVTVSPDKQAKAEAAFRKQFPNQAQYQQYLKVECKGSTDVLHEKIRRSLLIEKMMKLEVTDKSTVTPAMVREYYDKNGKEFEHEESVVIQTISIIPPQGASKDVIAGARKKADDALKQAKQTKTAEEFGLIAEKLSDDDWHTQMGARKPMNVKDLPPMVAKVVSPMKPGDVSDLVEVGNAWVIVRLYTHTPAGKTPFPEVQKKLSSDLQKQKTLDARSALNQKLHQSAKIEML
jgi:peptidyl-prolyl cis-trans isomerase SurA